MKLRDLARIIAGGSSLILAVSAASAFADALPFLPPGDARLRRPDDLAGPEGRGPSADANTLIEGPPTMPGTSGLCGIANRSKPPITSPTNFPLKR